MAAADPQLSQSLVLRVVLLQESLGGAPEKQKRSEAHRVTSWGAGSAGHAWGPPGRLHGLRHGAWAALVHADDVSDLSAGLVVHLVFTPGRRRPGAIASPCLLGRLSLSFPGCFGPT